MTQLPTANSGAYASSSSGRAAPGTTIGGRYELRAAIGHGGMGTVWRASDTLLHRDVAVKEVVLPPGLAASDRDAMYERTLREARAAAALSHPAVVQVYDVVTEGGRPWIVMELLDARSLADMVIEDGPVAPRAVAKIGIALLGALEVAHAAGVLHRDVKPANVLICVDGRCVLTDFGVARMPTDVQLTTPGMVLGSPHFISPERAMGGAFGPPSDLFSLGVTLYTAVEGRPPFDKGDPIETMHAVVEDPPAAAMRAGSLAEVLYGLLEKDPARRWDVGTARGRLRELLAGPLASSAPPHLATDPYAIVPAQRAARPPEPPALPPVPAPTGQIGGRAMLGPGESVAGRLRKLRGGSEPAEQTDPNLQRWDEPTGQGQAWPPNATASGPPPAGALAGIGGARAAAEPALSAVRAWPRRVQVLAAAGAVAVVAAATALVMNLGGGPGTPSGAAPPSGPTAEPTAAFPVQIHNDTARGVSVNVPEGWRKAAPKAAVYVDYTDPDDASRRVRILVENFRGTTPERFLGNAEKRMMSGQTSCAEPYARIGLRPVETGGQPSAELEYTCGTPDTMRHGIWRVVVRDGKAYSFFLTVSANRFDESKAVFDEMARSFTIGAAG